MEKPKKGKFEFGTGEVEEVLRRAEEEAPLGDEAFRALLYRRVREARLALLHSGIPQHQIRFEKLPGDVIGMVQDGLVYIEPVTLKSPQEFKRVLTHEGVHYQGIYSEGLVELIVKKTIGEHGTEHYDKEVRKVRKVTNLLDLEEVATLYRDEDYHILYGKFIAAYLRSQGRKLTGEESKRAKTKAETIFFEAFPELMKVSGESLLQSVEKEKIAA